MGSAVYTFVTSPRWPSMPPQRQAFRACFRKLSILACASLPGTSIQSSREWITFWHGSTSARRTSSACRKRSARMRGSPGWNLRPAATMLQCTVRRHSTASPSSQTAAGRVHARLPGDDTCRRALSKRWYPRPGVVRVACLYLPSTRRTGQIFIQNQMDGTTHRLRITTPGTSRGVAAGGISMSSRPRPMRAIRPPGRGMRYFCHVRGRNSARCVISVLPMPYAPAAMLAACTHSGIIRRVPGPRTTGSGSTTCCCRHRRPTG